MKQLTCIIIFVFTIITVKAQETGNFIINENESYENIEIASVSIAGVSDAESNDFGVRPVKRRTYYNMRNRHLNSNRNLIRHRNYGVLLKTNVLYDLTTTLNGGVEFMLGRGNRSHGTLEFSGNLNLWTLGKVKIQNVLLFTEYRYWRDRPYEGLYYGGLVMGGVFRAGGKKNPFKSEAKTQTDHTYSFGYVAGGGFTAGYAWTTRSPWGFELSGGLGILYAKYKKKEIEGGQMVLNKGDVYWTKTTVAPVKVAACISYNLAKRARRR